MIVYDFGCVYFYTFGNVRNVKCVFFSVAFYNADFECDAYEQWETQTLGMDGIE